MRYDGVIPAIFLERPNRFIAKVLVDGKEAIAHVKNTGRCRELLIPGVCVYLQKHNDPKRKTAYSLIAVKKGDLLINMDSQAPNVVAYEFLKAGNLIPDINVIKREKTFGDSRFDLYFETKETSGFIEVKGVTLEQDGIAMFPDAPTLRGVKHVYELAKAVEGGYEAGILFVVQMSPMKYFTPNFKMHPEFKQALIDVSKKGVFIKAFECQVHEDSLEIRQEIPVVLENEPLSVLSNLVLER